MNNDMYTYDGFYGPIPDNNGNVNLCLYAEKYIGYYKYIKSIPDKNMEYLNAVFTSDKYKVTNMNQMFSKCKHLLSIDVSKWDTSHVYNMDAVFNECESIKELDLNNWNTHNVLTMRYMFDSCYSLKTIKVDTWDVSNVVTMIGMFNECKNLNRIYMYLNTFKWKHYYLCDKTMMFNQCKYQPILEKLKNLIKIKCDNKEYGASENSILDVKIYKRPK